VVERDRDRTLEKPVRPEDRDDGGHETVVARVNALLQLEDETDGPRHGPDAELVERRNLRRAGANRRPVGRGDRAAEWRRPIESVIVNDDRDAVARSLHVELDVVDAGRDPRRERRDRVLGCQGRGAAVADDADRRAGSNGCRPARG
jgi:hypothetical protein